MQAMRDTAYSISDRGIVPTEQDPVEYGEEEDYADYSGLRGARSWAPSR